MIIFKKPCPQCEGKLHVYDPQCKDCSKRLQERVALAQVIREQRTKVPNEDGRSD